MAHRLNIIRGTTFNGLRITIEVNDAVVDLTDATIVAELTNEKTPCAKHTYNIGKGIEIEDAENGIILLLEDEVINWEKGVWYLVLTVTTQEYGVKKWIYKDYAFNVK